MTTSSQSHTSIPLNKLVQWSGNVRKTATTQGLEELTASIAAQGVLQSLVVRKTTRGKFAVVAGQRRYLALSTLAGDGTIAADAPVPCCVIPGTVDATEISLTENIVRAPMHPADQFEAFRELVDGGSSPAEIAARFGISETAVKQRLKLARVSPTVFQAYRDGELSLEQVQAFTVSDNHTAQDRVLHDLPEWNNDPDTIRDALTEGEIRASDRRARFVTLAAYEAAGGDVQRDLFADGEEGVFLLDSELLNRLVLEKLRAEVKMLESEGWKWIEIAIDFDYETRSQFGVRRPEPLPLSDEDTTRQKQLTEEYQRLFDGMVQDDDEVSERLDEIESQIAEIEESAERAFTPDVLAIAGAIVTIGGDGSVEIHRGLVKPEDMPEAEAGLKSSKPEGKPEFSASLVENLTQARSSAISAALSQRPDVALAAVVHALAVNVFFSYTERSSLQVSTKVTYFRKESKSASDLQRMREQWAERIPGDENVLWEWCLSQGQDSLLELLALCAACTVNAVQTKNDKPTTARLQHANLLSEALNLDMTAWFTPTSENFFSRVSRPTIVKALVEAKGTPAKRSWEKLKKSELAALAEREITGTGWLPQPLKSQTSA